AGVLVEGDHSTAVAPDVHERFRPAVPGTAAHLGDEQVAFDYRHAGNAKKILQHIEPGLCVHLPNHLAVAGPHAIQHPLGAIDLDPVAVHHGAAARAIVIAVGIAVIRRIFELPEESASPPFQAAQAGLVVPAVELKELGPADRRHAVAGAD